MLGGHSLGASLTAAYASWDFNGTPGYKDIDGMVLIDGGLMGSFDAFTTTEAQSALTNLESGSPFLDLLGLGIPEIAGIFGEIGGIYARAVPNQSATTLQSFPLLPPAFNPPLPVTNQALLGYAFDRDTSPASLSLLHINAGALAQGGDPRDWQDGGVTPVQRLAETFGQEPANAIEWYFPRRLSIDTNGANDLVQNDVANLLGLRVFHQPKVDIPLYAIQTDLTKGRVLLRGEQLHRPRADHEEGIEPDQRRSRAVPPRPADGRGGQEQVLHHGGPVPAQQGLREPEEGQEEEGEEQGQGQEAEAVAPQDVLQVLLRLPHIAGESVASRSWFLPTSVPAGSRSALPS